MEASTMDPQTTPPIATPPAEGEVETPVEETPGETTVATEQTPAKLFKWNEWVHVGEGASECAEPWKCADHQHFHAWLRLPNQFQYDTIRDKALASKARKIRQLKDSDTDAFEILEGELDAIRNAPGAHEYLVGELVQKEHVVNVVEARKDATEVEGYETIDDDFQRLKTMMGMDADERNHDEYVELQNHIAAFTAEVEKHRIEREAPLRSSLEAKGVDDLIDMIRDDRIEAAATEEFMRVYSQWLWVVCTMKPRDPAKGFPTEQHYKDLNTLHAAPPEVLSVLDNAYAALESAMGDAGKS